MTAQLSGIETMFHQVIFFRLLHHRSNFQIIKINFIPLCFVINTRLIKTSGKVDRALHCTKFFMNEILSVWWKKSFTYDLTSLSNTRIEILERVWNSFRYYISGVSVLLRWMHPYHEIIPDSRPSFYFYLFYKLFEINNFLQGSYSIYIKRFTHFIRHKKSTKVIY